MKLIEVKIIRIILCICFICASINIQSQKSELSVQTGHSASINKLSFSPNGELLASTDEKGKIAVWNVSLGKEMISFHDEYELTSCMFFPDKSTRIITGNTEGDVKIWDVEHSELINKYQLQGEISDICFSGESTVFVAANKIYKLNLENGDTTVVLNERCFEIIYNKEEKAYWFFNINGKLCKTDNDGNKKEDCSNFLRRKGERKAKKLAKKRNKKEKKSSTLYNRQKKIYSVMGLNETEAYMLSVIGSQIKSNLESYEKKNALLDILAFSDKYNNIIYANVAPLRAFNIKKHKRVYNHIADYPDMPYLSIAVSDKNNLLIAGSKEGKIFIYELSSGKKIKVRKCHLTEVRSIIFSPDGSMFATTGKDRSIILWDSKTLEQINRLYSRAFLISCVATGNNNKSLAFGNEMGYVKSINLNSPDFDFNSYKSHVLQVSDMSFSLDDSLIISGGWDNRVVFREMSNTDNYKRIKFWGGANKKPEINPKINEAAHVFKGARIVDLIDISSDGKKLAVAGRNNWVQQPIIGKLSVILYDLENLENNLLIKTQPRRISTLEFNPSNYDLFTGNPDGLKYWKKEADKYKSDTVIKKISNPQSLYEWLTINLNPSDVEWLDDNTMVYNTDSALIWYDVNKSKEISRKEEIGIKKLKLLEKDKIIIGLNNDIKIENIKEPYEPVILKGHANDITGLELIAGTKMLVSSSLDGTLKLWNYESYKLISTIIPIDKDKFIFITPDNYYMAPKSSLDGIGFKYGSKFFPAQQFDLKFNRPDIVLSRIGLASEELINAYHKAYLKRLKKMGFKEENLSDELHLPETKLLNFEHLPLITDSSEIELQLNFKDSKYDLDKINIKINDVPVFGSAGIDISNLNKQEVNKNVNIELAKGKNIITVSVINEKGAESLKETIDITNNAKEEKPNLYIVAIGVSDYKDSRFNLNYASKDASDISALLGDSKAFNEVHTKLLTDDMVTRENILQLKEFFEKAGRDDVVMLFIAGHGVLDSDFDYYFGTYDLDFNDPAKRGIEYSEIESLLDGIKSLRKMLFMDTCYSGEVDKDEIEIAQNAAKEMGDITFRSSGTGVKNKTGMGLNNSLEVMKELFADLRNGTGSTVVSSAGGVEFAMESDKWQNGLFTYCVLSGFDKKDADINKDGKIMLSELRKYVREKVNDLSGGQQVPTSRMENISMDIRMW